MGTQWYRGQLGLTLQRTLIRHSEGLGNRGVGVVPYKDRLTPGRTTEKAEG